MGLTLEQTENRLGGITGTDIAAICGVHPYKSAMDVYCEKLQLVEPRRETAAMRLGPRLENTIAEEYERETGERLQEVVTCKGMGRHDWLRGTPDRVIKGKNKGVELKTAGFRQYPNWGPPGTDIVPSQYLLQCAWYMALLDYNEWDIALFPLGWTPDEAADSLIHIYPLKRDTELENSLFRKAEIFWYEHVKKEVPPALDGSASAEAWLKKVYPVSRGAELLPASFEVEELFRAYNDSKRRGKAITEEVDTLENQLKNLIGSGAGFHGGDWHITWKNNKDGLKTDWRQVALEANASQALIDKYTVPVPGARVFRTKKEA